jgi:hypothetical protein
VGLEPTDPCSRRLRLATSLGVLGAIFAAGTGWLVLSRPATTSARPDVAPPGAHASASGAPAAGPAAFVAPSRWVTLPAGSKLVTELPVRFPHTPAGAAAAAVASVQFGWTTDPVQAARVAALYTTTRDAALVTAQAAETAGALRARFALPAAGPLAADAGVSVRAIGTQWKVLGRDRVQVSVLAELRGQSAAGAPTGTELVAVTALMVWVGADGDADWKGSATSGRLPTPAPAALGTAAFNAAGWAAIQETRT